MTGVTLCLEPMLSVTACNVITNGTCNTVSSVGMSNYTAIGGITNNTCNGVMTVITDRYYLMITVTSISISANRTSILAVSIVWGMLCLRFAFRAAYCTITYPMYFVII